ncbi:MAG: response regulator [Candidatus Zixiibacteriota bacterium]
MKNAITILVVDDELMMRNLMEKILVRDGYKVLTAENGDAALELLKNNQVNIVISDMKMPEMNGFDLLKIVKKEYPHIGMIMMTAYGDTYTVKDALLLGADEYITKPFKSFEVSMVVERAYWRILSSTNAEPKVKQVN